MLSGIHDGSHLDLNRTNKMVPCKYYRPGLFKDIETTQVRTLHHCTTDSSNNFVLPPIGFKLKCQCNSITLQKTVGVLQAGKDLIGIMPVTPREMFNTLLLSLITFQSVPRLLLFLTAFGVARFINKAS